MKRLVFVCTGNTCRSPMAQAIFTGLLAERNIKDIEVSSAGLAAVNGLPASPEAIKAMTDEGFDLSRHQSRQLSPDLITPADYILTMTVAQRDHLRDKHPDKALAVSAINDFAGKGNQDIVDPFGRGIAAYKECAEQLKKLLPQVLDRMSELEKLKTGDNKVAIGSDHAGFDLKSVIIKTLSDANYEVLDCGTFSDESVDYPDIAENVAAAVLTHKIKGIIICGTGVGISIAANKIPGIRAALCYNRDCARLARQHNDANIVAVGARMLEQDLAVAIVKTFLATGFEAGRHQRRIEKIMELEKKCLGRSNQGGLY
ncbi:ribose 5-phosphate isomerase B [Syntrophomonas curvata]